jgi:hypothetical protein
LLQIIAYHVDLMTLTDGTNELIPEPDEGISEARVNVAKDLSEALNQGSEDTASLTPASPVKASPRA